MIGRAHYINYPEGLVNWEVVMIMKIIPVLLSALMIAGTASATQLTRVSGTPGALVLEELGAAARNFSPLVKQASYCRRDCTWCRDDCYNAYRINCYWEGCRRQFTLCMRGCWYNICKWC